MTEFARYPSLHGRSVFVTGGATGIGAALVAQFARQGARVAFADIDEAAGLALAQAEGALFLPCDVREVAALQAAIATAAARHGPLTVLVNNAARDDRHRWQDVTPAYWDERMHVNLRPHFFAVQAVAPMMREAGGGSVIALGSVSWRVGQGGMPAYSAAKAGIEGLTRGLARDLGPDRIRVNCIIPGWIMTQRQRAFWLTPEAERDLLAAQCLKQTLGPDDVARLALWLAADDSRMCTSQSWVVDGGWSF